MVTNPGADRLVGEKVGVATTVAVKVAVMVEVAVREKGRQVLLEQDALPVPIKDVKVDPTPAVAVQVPIDVPEA
jgi:hypothetical protein